LLSATIPWKTRIWQEFHAGNLTRGYRDVLLTLRTYRGHGGLAWPSHATLALRAGCCVKTVQRALSAAQELGLVSWAERRMRAAWRWLRTSNVYRFHQPADPVQSRGAPCSATKGQKVRAGEREEKQEAREGRAAALTELLRAAAGLPDLLLARREAVAAQQRRGQAPVRPIG
jgi:Helix-turn-helix domain